TGSVPSMVRYVPMESKFSNAKPIGSISWWHPEHAGSAECAVKRARALVPDSAGGSVTFASGGGGGGGWHSIFSRTNLPRRTGDVWSGCARTARTTGKVTLT